MGLTLCALKKRNIGNDVVVARDAAEPARQLGICWPILNRPPPMFLGK